MVMYYDPYEARHSGIVPEFMPPTDYADYMYPDISPSSLGLAVADFDVQRADTAVPAVRDLDPVDTWQPIGVFRPQPDVAVGFSSDRIATGAEDPEDYGEDPGTGWSRMGPGTAQVEQETDMETETETETEAAVEEKKDSMGLDWDWCRCSAFALEMKYSVYNATLGNYTVYEGPATERRLLPSSTSLGSVPELVSGYLPLGSVCLGQSDNPEGKVVERDRDVRGFALELAIIIPVMLLAKVIYDWCKK